MTTRRSLAVPLVLLAVFSINGLAQSKPATGGSADGPLAPVAWLVGGAWVSDGKDSSDGSVTHVENHQAIEFNTDFDGKPHYNGFYAYNRVAKTIGLYYTNSEGELTIGTATPDTSEPFGGSVLRTGLAGLSRLGEPYLTKFLFFAYKVGIQIPDLELPSGTYYIQLQDVVWDTRAFWAVSGGPSAGYYSQLGPSEYGARTSPVQISSESFAVLGEWAEAAP
jgi:hypothetical protein